MHIEYEATYIDINKDEIREKLKEIGAKLIRPEFMQKRVTFNLPVHNNEGDRFVRVRDEGDKITMTFKIFEGNNIDDQKEINLTVDDFDKTVIFLEKTGFCKKSYQETKREIWNMDGAEICIDEWPFLEPFVEIEGKSEDEVKFVSDKLGFDYDKALFCPTGKIYEMKYGFPEKVINNEYPLIVFEMENPFIK